MADDSLTVIQSNSTKELFPILPIVLIIPAIEGVSFVKHLFQRFVCKQL